MRYSIIHKEWGKINKKKRTILFKFYIETEDGRLMHTHDTELRIAYPEKLSGITKADDCLIVEDDDDIGLYATLEKAVKALESGKYRIEYYD